MAHPLKQAESSAKKFEGQLEDYLPIDNWFDEPKAFLPDFRQPALRHRATGSSCASASSRSLSPTAKASMSQCAISGNSM